MNYILPPKFSRHIYFKKLNVKLRLPRLTNCYCKSAIKDPEKAFCKNHEDLSLCQHSMLPDVQYQHDQPNGSNFKTITYLLTPGCRVLLEKLTGLQLVKKFPAFHGTRTFITALTSVRHLSLSWATPIQSIYPHPTSFRSILLLSTIYA